VRISHDEESGALYIKLRDGGYDHTEDFSEKADVYVDVDAEGHALGLKAFSLDDLATATGEVIHKYPNRVRVRPRAGKASIPPRSLAYPTMSARIYSRVSLRAA